MDKMTRKIVVAFIIMIAAAALILAGYYMLDRKGLLAGDEAEALPKTEVGKLEAKDLELEYPSTPTEVVKLYWRFNKCMYNTSMKDKDFESLLKQLRLLYDDEFLAADGNSYEEMLSSFQEDKKAFNKANRVISSYTVDAESDVEYGAIDDRECASLTTSTLETINKSKNTQTYAKFMCRRDEDGKWKILGWEKTSASDTEEK